MSDRFGTRDGAQTGRVRAAGSLLGVLLLCASAGCASRGFVPPTGPGRPAPDAAARLDEAVARCRGASSYVGVTSISGRIGAENVPSVRIDVGVTRDGGIALDGSAVGRTIFWLSGREEQANLYLAQDAAGLTYAAPAIVEALVGLELTPDRLLAILTGCISREVSLSDAAAYEDDLTRVTTPDGTLFLERDQARWRVVAGQVDRLTVEIVEVGPAFPSLIRVRSDAGVVPEVDLRIRTSPPIRVNDVVNEAVFAKPMPPAATPITIEDLRAAGPLRDRAAGGSSPRP